MATLQIAAKVAAHPRMVNLLKTQEEMRRGLVRDYGDLFMVTGREMPNMTLSNGRTSPRYPGVHFWTFAQRSAWNSLDGRIRNLRAALRKAYE
jgi:hypothetical protein